MFNDIVKITLYPVGRTMISNVKIPLAKMCQENQSKNRDRPVKTGKRLMTLCTNPLKTFLWDTICLKRPLPMIRAAVLAQYKNSGSNTSSNFRQLSFVSSFPLFYTME